MTKVGFLAAAALLVAVCPSLGQEVRGTAVDAASGRPIEGAFVSLLNEADAAVASDLTGVDGAFILHPPVAGLYRLRVERIGYQSWTSESFDVVPFQTVTRRLRVAVRPVTLEALDVRVTNVCADRSRGGIALARTWEEARKALEVVSWTERATGMRFELRRWERALDPESERVRAEQLFEGERRAWHTFVSAPAGDLSAQGYVRPGEDRTWYFFAPDAEVLLSDVFADDHCFSLIRGEGEEAGLVGLAFEPVPGRMTPDVEGVLWLDGATSALRHLTFTYTNSGLEPPLGRYPTGGRVEFAQLPTGHWFVRRWHLRMPVAGERTGVRLRAGPGGSRFEPRKETLLARVHEAGGEAVRATLPGGETLTIATWGAVEGTVRDSTDGSALAGVEIELDGTAYRGRTDREGHFRIGSVPPGDYTLVARHPDAELLGFAPRDHPVSVAEERVARADVAFPSEVIEGRRPIDEFGRDARQPDLEAVVDELLASAGDRVAETEDRGLATLVGMVRAAEDGRPVAGARVRLLERPEERVTGHDGAFALTGLPRGRYRVVTEYLGLASDTADVDLRLGTGQVALFTLETRPVQLPTLEVEIERTLRNHRLAGFYERMRRGLGDFITRSDLEARDVIHNIRRLPNVQVQQCLNPSTRLRMSDCWDIKIARGVLGNVLTGGGRCPPLIYVDGHLLPRSDMGDDASGSASGADGGRVFGTNGFTLLQNLPRDVLEGIEVYRSPAGAPAQYRTLGDACGIILVWTRGR